MSVYKDFRSRIFSLKLAWHQNNEAPIPRRVMERIGIEIFTNSTTVIIIEKTALFSCILNTRKIQGKAVS